MLKRQARK